jgi:hypothetical protein
VEAAVWLGIQQVESFRRRNGRVPGVQEMGPLPPGVRYERVDARRYILVGKGDRVIVTFGSEDPVDALEDAALRTLGEPEGE